MEIFWSILSFLPKALFRINFSVFVSKTKNISSFRTTGELFSLTVYATDILSQDLRPHELKKSEAILDPPLRLENCSDFVLLSCTF